jgi:3-oxoacyl-[acyl-carrier-protein] synthase II
MKRIVVTGMGMVSPLGPTVSQSWKKLINSESGLRKIQQCDVSDMACQIGGEILTVPEGGAPSPELLNIDAFVEPRNQSKMGRYAIFGIAAADEALKDAGWLPETDEQKERTGVLIGSGIGGLEGIYQNSVALVEKGPRRVNPFFIPACLINLTSGNVSIKYGLKGPNHSVVTACSTGAHAIGDAARLIQYGDADVMVAGGTEASICRIGIAGFAALRALSTSYNDRPTEGSRPWDKGRDGFVMGEGAGIVVLESLEHAQNRGAKIYAEIVGYGLSGDAYHVTAPDGDGAYRAMKMALNRAGIAPEDIGYINAHGTSTPVGDVMELQAVQRLFGQRPKLSMSSTKSSIGHLLGAAGSVEAIFSILAMQEGILPPTLNLNDPDPAAEGVDLIPLKAKEKKVDYVLSNSFGFGGTNASLIFKRFS